MAYAEPENRGRHCLKVSHSRRTAWCLVLAPRAKALGSLGGEVFMAVVCRSVKARKSFCVIRSSAPFHSDCHVSRVSVEK